jgi:glycosyltransferase involved in cell wall biosynthesis
MKANHKILFLTDSLSNGGAERQLVLLLKYLPQGWDAKLCSLDDGPFLYIVKEMRIPTLVIPRRFRYDVIPFVRLWRLINHERPDLVHAWGWLSTFAAGPLCKALSIPLVDSAIRSGMKMLPPSRIASAWADLVISNSQAGMRSSGIHPDRVRVIYNGFDPDRLMFCQSDRGALSEVVTVVMTGRMVREKDFVSYLSAAQTLHCNDPKSWKFLAIGKGPDRESLILSSKDLVNRGGVAFPDAGLEVLGYIRWARIGVLLTNAKYHAEGLSNSIMEYMACGLPVICSNNGGNEELIIEGETGFLIAPGDTKALVERLLYLQQNPEVADRMGRCGRERLINHFSVEKMLNNLLSVYQEVLPKQ